MTITLAGVYVKSLCHCVQYIHFYSPMTGQFIINRPRLHQIGVSHVLPKVQPLVKTVLTLRLKISEVFVDHRELKFDQTRDHDPVIIINHISKSNG